jgi:hypothetical protein
LAYIDNNEITTSQLMEYIKGPDLPTGGILIGEKSMLSAYETGEGKVAYRAKTSIEKLDNGRLGIVITEFPYRRNKARLLQLISEMTGDKRHAKSLESITDLRDESDRNGIRAVIELKKNAGEDVAATRVHHGLCQSRPKCEEWTIEVYIYGSPKGNDNYEIIGIHKAVAVQASFEARIRDTAKYTLARVCESNRSSLRETFYDYFPYRKRGSRDIKVKSTTHEESGVVHEQVLLATTLHEDMDEALDEL